MIAKIKTKDNMIYDTIVFATIMDAWNSKLIGFNQDFDRLELIDFWKIKLDGSLARLIFIVDTKKDLWIKNEKIEGVEWIIRDENLLQQIKDKKEVNISILEKCKQMQSEIIVNEWNIINTNEDIKNVSRAALGFHDSVVEKINKINYSNIVEVIFNTTWDCKIIIRFDEVEFRCAEEYGRMGEIFECALFFEKGFIYWVDCNIDNSQDISEEMCFFKSKKASWKIEVV